MDDRFHRFLPMLRRRPRGRQRLHAAFEGRAENDLTIVQSGGGQSRIPTVEPSARRRNERDVVVFHTAGVQVDAQRMEFPQLLLDRRRIPTPGSVGSVRSPARRQ